MADVLKKVQHASLCLGTTSQKASAHKLLGRLQSHDRATVLAFLKYRSRIASIDNRLDILYNGVSVRDMKSLDERTILGQCIPRVHKHERAVRREEKLARGLCATSACCRAKELKKKSHGIWRQPRFWLLKASNIWLSRSIKERHQAEDQERARRSVWRKYALPSVVIFDRKTNAIHTNGIDGDPTQCRYYLSNLPHDVVHLFRGVFLKREKTCSEVVPLISHSDIAPWFRFLRRHGQLARFKAIVDDASRGAGDTAQDPRSLKRPFLREGPDGGEQRDIRYDVFPCNALDSKLSFDPVKHDIIPKFDDFLADRRRCPHVLAAGIAEINAVVQGGVETGFGELRLERQSARVCAPKKFVFEGERGRTERPANGANKEARKRSDGLEQGGLTATIRPYQNRYGTEIVKRRVGVTRVVLQTKALDVHRSLPFLSRYRHTPHHFVSWTLGKRGRPPTLSAVRPTGAEIIPDGPVRAIGCRNATAVRGA